MLQRPTRPIGHMLAKVVVLFHTNADPTNDGASPLQGRVESDRQSLVRLCLFN